MRHASGVIGPSKSATSSCEGGLLSLPTPVTPSRSYTTASYSRFRSRGICEVAGTPGTHIPGGPPLWAAAAPAPLAPLATAAPPASPLLPRAGEAPSLAPPHAVMAAANAPTAIDIRTWFMATDLWQRGARERPL